MITHPHAIVQREAPANSPLILRVRLQQMDFIVGKRTAALLAVTIEVSQKRIGVSETGAA